MDTAALIIVGTVIALFLLLNIVATYIVFNACFEIKERRLYQTLFIWLVPFIGAFLAIYTNREDYFEEKNKKKIGNQTSITDSEATTHYFGGNNHGGR